MANRNQGPQTIPDLRDVIDDKIVEIIDCARRAGWQRDEVLISIEDCIAFRWPKESDAPPDNTCKS